jgi:hypothetical protein
MNGSLLVCHFSDKGYKYFMVVTYDLKITAFPVLKQFIEAGAILVASVA